MIANQSMVTYDELVEILRDLVESEETGTLYLATNDNHAASFGLENGNLVSIRCQGFKGINALDALLGIESGRCRFVAHSAGLYEKAAPLPPTQELLGILETQRVGATSAPPATGTAPLQTGNGSGVALPLSDCRSIVTEEATEYLGPMGGFVCDELFDEVAPTTIEDVTTIIDRVANEIGDPKREKEFKTRVLQRL